MQAQMERIGCNLESINLAELAGDVVHNYGAKVRSHRLHFECDGACPILGNHEQLKQLLVNLLSNATRHSAPEREVTVCVWQCGSDVHLIVQDQGKGKGKGALCAGVERLFLPFKSLEYYREYADQEDHRYLSSIQNIIEAHGGDISIQGDPEQGTAINVRLEACCP